MLLLLLPLRSSDIELIEFCRCSSGALAGGSF